MFYQHTCQYSSRLVVNGCATTSVDTALTLRSPTFRRVQLRYLPTDKDNRLARFQFCQLGLIHRFEVRTFFKVFNHGRWADLQHTRRISDATAIECHLYDLLLYFQQMTLIAIISNKCAARTLRASTFLALSACMHATDHV